MKLFNVTPYLLLLEQENSNEETLSKANAEFVKEVYELQRAENDITIVLFQLQYLSCRLVILREHYRTAQKEHLICYSYIIGTLTIAVGEKFVQFGRFPKFVNGLAEFLFRPAKEKGIYQSDKECRDFLIPCTNYGFKCYIHIFLIYSLDSHL